MDKFSLIMVLHSHQPVGNFDHVFAYAVERCYKPVLDILTRYPEFKCALHFSGPLLSWLEAHDPDFLDMAAGMCEQGQVEMLSGGYYEPLLASIPHQDAGGPAQQAERVHPPPLRGEPHRLLVGRAHLGAGSAGQAGALRPQIQPGGRHSPLLRGPERQGHVRLPYHRARGPRPGPLPHPQRVALHHPFQGASGDPGFPAPLPGGFGAQLRDLWRRQ